MAHREFEGDPKQCDPAADPQAQGDVMIQILLSLWLVFAPCYSCPYGSECRTDYDCDDCYGDIERGVCGGD